MTHFTFYTCLRCECTEIPFVGTMDRPILAPYKGCSDDGIWIEVHWEMIKKKNLAIISTVKWPYVLKFKDHSRSPSECR